MIHLRSRRPRIRDGIGFAWVAAVAGCAVGTPSAVTRPAATTIRPPFISITLERTPCFGTCPVYLVSIAGDGAVLFEGRFHVDSARVTSHLNVDDVAALAQLFDESQFFALADKYVSGEENCSAYATDAPMVITSIAIDGRSKRVEHDRGCSGVPGRLSLLEDRIDGIVRVWRWTTGQPPR